MASESVSTSNVVPFPINRRTSSRPALRKAGEAAAEGLTPVQQRMVEMIMRAMDNPGESGDPKLELVGEAFRKVLRAHGRAED